MKLARRLVPAALAGKLAWTSLRTGAGWVRFAQWDAVATHLALGAAFGAASLAFVRNA